MSVPTSPAIRTGLQNLSSGHRLISLGVGLALTAAAVRRRTPVPALLGAALVLRGGSGYCPVTDVLRRDPLSVRSRLSGRRGTHVRARVRIERPPAVVYGYWRRLDRLAEALPDTLRVQPLDDVHSRWTLLAAGGVPLASWTAELINDIPGRLVAWQTTGDSTVVSAGSVQFTATPDQRATEVQVHLQFAPPFGRLGAGLASLSGKDASTLVRRGLADIARRLERPALVT
jgi:uncharacterized membrane protein